MITENVKTKVQGIPTLTVNAGPKYILINSGILNGLIDLKKSYNL